jgi:glucose/arabinose dehydrogenase
MLSNTFRYLLRAFLLSLGLLAWSAAGAQAVTLPADFTDMKVASVDRATGTAFTPDGRLLIASADGKVRVYANGALAATPSLDVSAKVCSDGERGMMAVTVDPDFQANHYIYVYFTWKKFGTCPVAPSSQLPVNRVERYVLGDNDVADPASARVLIDNIPAPQTYHIGADLKFGKDGYLYVSTGDGGCNYLDSNYCDQWNTAARDENVLLGKVLRITRDGGVPPDNPFLGPGTARCASTGITSPGNKCQETYAWGLRNPFRLAFDPNASGTRFFINDTQEITWEEIDLGQAGADYGWNVREGHCATGSETDCGPPPAGMTNPIYDYYHYTEGCYAITGGAFVPNGFWSASFDGSYLFADFVCGKIFKLTRDAGGTYSATDFATAAGQYSMVTMEFGPYASTQALYYVTAASSPDEIHRITYTGRPNRPAASPLQVALVPAFRQTISASQCQARGGAASTHGAPLALASCNPPAYVPGTAARLAGTGSAQMTVVEGNLVTAANDADVSISVSAADVRDRQSGGDYDPSGGADVSLEARLRLSDTYNGTYGSDPATASDFQFPVPIGCSPTASAATGSTCAIATTANALIPGAIREGTAASAQVFGVRLKDSGPDRLEGNGDDKLFAQQGLFVR